MSAARQVLDMTYLDLIPGRTFAQSLPADYLADEPQREGLIEIWNNEVCPAVNEIFHFLQAALLNRHLRQTIFESRLQAVADDFSRRTECVKVTFVKDMRIVVPSGCLLKRYQFQVTRLRPLDESQRRNVAIGVAETSSQDLPEVQAECVGAVQTSSGDSDHVVTTEDTRIEAVSGTGHERAIVYEARGGGDPDNPPLAVEVTPVTDRNDSGSDTTTTTRPSTRERMQALESIKVFLSAAEYEAKRREILESI